METIENRQEYVPTTEGEKFRSTIRWTIPYLLITSFFVFTFMIEKSTENQNRKELERRSSIIWSVDAHNEWADELGRNNPSLVMPQKQEKITIPKMDVTE